MLDFNGRDVVVTGGAGALGGAVVKLLLERGATVHVPLLEAALPEGTPWAGHTRVVAVPNVTLTDERAVERFFAEVPAPWASIHLAGGWAGAPVLGTSLADYEKMHAINGVTCFLACREAVRAMRTAGRGGRIVNVISRAVHVHVPGQLAYIASKAEVAAITQAIACEVRDDAILVNAVAPSIIDTPANRAARPKADHSQWPRPREIAEAVAFLASPANTLTSGALVPVYGRA
jgi:NAD(P)-dependent dehydrogenase (short-subunit alcohol dehydrogenase family)